MVSQFQQGVGLLIWGSFCTAMFPTPRHHDLKFWLPQEGSNGGSYWGISKKKSRRQAFSLSLSYTAFELASLVLPQRVPRPSLLVLKWDPSPQTGSTTTSQVYSFITLKYLSASLYPSSSHWEEVSQSRSSGPSPKLDLVEQCLFWPLYSISSHPRISD